MSGSRLCESQAAQGSEVHVYTTTANGREELSVSTGVPQEVDGVWVTYFRRLTGDHTHVAPALWLHLWRTVRQYDAVHIHSWWNPLVVVATLICVLRGVRPVLSPRGMLGRYTLDGIHSPAKKLIHRLGGQWLLRRTCLHATSQLEWQDCHALIPGWSGFLLPNIIQLPRETPLRRENEVFTIAFLSRIDPKKGLELALQALAQVDFPFVLQLAGSADAGYRRQLEKLIDTLGLTPRVTWAGWKSGDEKFEFLASADVMILTSYNENFANVVVEALAVGTPVLVSRQVGLYDFVEQERMGWVCDLTVEDVRTQLTAAFREKEVRKRIATTAPAKVRSCFSSERLARQYQEAYDEQALERTREALAL